MSTDAFVDLISRLSYKPGWSVGAVYDPARLAVQVRVAFTVPDAVEDPARVMPLRIKHYLPEHDVGALDEPAALRLVGGWVLEMERHEFREWFKLDGVPVYPAHGPNGELL